MFNPNKLFEKINFNPKNFFVYNPFLRSREIELDLQTKLVKIIVSASDPEELKNKIVREVAIALKAYRCFFVEYDPETNNFKTITNAYNQKREALSILGIDIEKAIPSLGMKQKYIKYTVIEDTNKFLKENNLQGKDEDAYFNKYNVKSAIAVRLEFGEIFLGLLVLHYEYKKSNLVKTDLKFLQDLAEHISIALHLSSLYVEEKAERTKERLLRTIISIMSKSFNLDKITKKIFEILDVTYNPQSIFINIETDNFQNIYSSISDKNLNIADLISIYKTTIFESNKSKMNYIPDTHNFIIQNNLEDSELEAHFRNNNIKSLVLAPIMNDEKFCGVFIFQFDKPNLIKSNDLFFIQTIIEQFAIALKQSLDFKKEKESAERERILRDITTKIRNSIKIEEIRYEIVNQIGIFFNADRVVLSFYDHKSKNYIVPPYAEYKSSQSIKTFVGVDFASYEGFNNYIRDVHFSGNDIIFSDIDTYLVQNDLVGSGVEKFYREFGFLSCAAINIYYLDAFLGDIVITFENKRNFSNEDINFIKTLAEQAGVAFYQAELLEKTNKQLERESLLRRITERIRKSVDLDDTFKFICIEIAKLFKVQRVMISQQLISVENSNFIIRGEHKTNPTLKGLLDCKNPQDIVRYWVDSESKEQMAYDNIHESETPDYFKECYNDIGIKSIIGEPIKKGYDTWGLLILSEYNQIRYWSDEEKSLLKTIANQIYIAINQTELYNSLKQTTANQKAILNNIPYWAWLKDKDNRFILVNKILAEDLKLPVESFVGKTDYDFFSKELADAYRQEDQEVINSGKQKIKEEKTIIDGQNRFLETYKQPLLDNHGKIIGTVGIAQDITEKKESELELRLRQEKIIKANEKECLLRKIFEAMRGSLDINTVKNTIVNEIGKALNSDRCFILTYKKDDDYFVVDEYSEYLSPYENKSLINFDTKSPAVKQFMELFKRNEEVAFSNSDEYIAQNNLKNMPEDSFLKEYNIKSGYNISIYYANKLLGYIIIQYTKDYKEMDESDLEFLRTLATQAGIALHQAELYQLTQNQAETEKFNRKILEILRNTLDKSTIKRLFVKNIGQYFQANRVFFSDYDSKSKMFLPVETGAEYLSSPEEKSFVGYNFSDSSLNDYIQPLLDKRELKIQCWDEEMKDKQLSEGFTSRFKDVNVNSSYNFPVIYEGEIMGFFCIEFTQKGCNKLSDENINGIRNLCTQAGIALYHADLYAKAQEIAIAKTKFMANLYKDVNEKLKNIETIAEAMTQAEPICDKHIEFLTELNENLKNLKQILD